MKSSTALKTIRRQAEEIRNQKKIIEAALDHAWNQHVSVFRIHGTPTEDEQKWKMALLTKWMTTARKME